MKSLLSSAGVLAAAGAFAFSTGNLVTLVVGDGGDVAGNQPTAMREFTTSGAVVGSDLSFTNVGGRNLTVSYGERSEGGLQISDNQQFLMAVGYDLAPRDAGFNTLLTNRVVSAVNIGGVRSFSAGFQIPAGDGVRQVWSSTGSDYVGVGGDAGLLEGTFTSTTASQILPTIRSSRSLQKYGNTFYFLGSNAFGGVNGVASWDGVNQVDLFPTPDGASGRDIYVVNDRTIYVGAHTTGTGLVKMVTDDSGNWVEAYRITGTGVEHMAVYGNDIYTTSAQGTFIAKTTDTGTGFIPWTTIVTNTVPNTRFRGLEFAPRPKVQGTITLGDISGSAAGKVITLEVWQGTTLVSTTLATLNAAGQYSAGINVTGNCTVSVKGAPFLRKTSSVVNLTIGTPINVNLTLTNGDVDGSGEVDAVDIDRVIADFGATGSERESDVDRSLEVDAVDIDVVIANFGAVDL